jgi:hypothetical protein
MGWDSASLAPGQAGPASRGRSPGLVQGFSPTDLVVKTVRWSLTSVMP